MVTDWNLLGVHIGCILDTAVYAAIACLVLAVRQPLWGFARSCWTWYTRDVIRIHILQEPSFICQIRGEPLTCTFSSNQSKWSALDCGLFTREWAHAADSDTYAHAFSQCACSCCRSSAWCQGSDRGHISHSVFKMFSVAGATGLASKLRSHFSCKTLNSEGQSGSLWLSSPQRLQQALQDDHDEQKHGMGAVRVGECQCCRPIRAPSAATEDPLDSHACSNILAEVADNGLIPQLDYTRKSRTNATTRVNSNISQVTASTAAANAAKAEIIRLESLCEARTKELTHTKMQLRATGQAFDAMAVLVNYCCADLKAFECPLLANNLQTVQKQLTGCLAQIADLNCQKDTLDNNMAQIMQEKDEATKRAEEACDIIDKEREEHRKITQEMDDTHNAALTTQRDELTSKHDENVKKLTQFHDRQIDLLRLAHDRQISDMKNENKLDMNALKISHLEEIQELRNKHDSQMEELHKQHRNKLEDITHRFEAIKLTLSEKLESLRGECDELARRARNSEDALQRDADAKVQIALAPYLSLPKEIESLKTVLEMRNEEVQKLRSKNMDFEKQLEEIPIAREKIISLQQKVENLEAIINIKTDHEKQLHEKCQILMRKYDRESRANKRLSMDYEQVVWRMSQSSEFGSSESLTKRHFSRSPPRSKEGSPDTRQRAASPVCGQSDVIMRVKKRSSHSISEGDRKLRSRSETFVVEKTESSDSHSPSLSPQLKLKRWRKKSQANEAADTCTDLEQMCHSAGAEILPDPCRQQMQSSSLSLNDVNNSNIESSDLADSYGRSSSGVSDSGMCDSISKSDVLDCSIVSTDSEWGTSVNLSRKCDSTLEDLESGPEAGDYHSLNNITMIEATGSSCNTSIGNVCMNTVSSGAPPSYENRAQYQNEDHEQSNNYHFSITLPQASQVAGDSTFDNNANSL